MSKTLCSIKLRKTMRKITLIKYVFLDKSRF